MIFNTDGVPQEVTVNNASASNIHENSSRSIDGANRLPKLKNKLDKRVLITKGSDEAAILAKAAARVQSSIPQMNGE